MMQRNIKDIVCSYITDCYTRDVKTKFSRCESKDNLGQGLLNIADIYLMNPKKVERNLMRFKDASSVTKEALFTIVERLYVEPDECRNAILFNLLRNDVLTFASRDYLIQFETFVKLDLVEALFWAYKFKSKGITSLDLSGINLSKCWRQFCGVLLVLNEGVTVKFGWNSDTDAPSTQEWQLLCYVIENTKINLIITNMNKLSDDSKLISKNKLMALSKSLLFRSGRSNFPSLKELSSSCLFFKTTGVLMLTEKNISDANKESLIQDLRKLIQNSTESLPAFLDEEASQALKRSLTISVPRSLQK